MNALESALVTVIVCGVALYCMHRYENTVLLLHNHAHGLDTRSMRRYRFRSFDVLWFFDNTLIQFAQSLPCSHMAFVLKGFIVTISHSHAFQILPVKRYLRSYFRQKTSKAYVVVESYSGSEVRQALQSRVMRLLQNPKITYHHLYWRRLLRTSSPIWAGSPRPVSRPVDDYHHFYCSELTLRALQTAGLIRTQTDPSMLPGELVGNLNQHTTDHARFEKPFVLVP